eukprot:TRINITY_DN1126_c0_g1_i4.p1 TRINITY_DN1126_c0_g1~~TRINITY_DN1126_c0_g1_i4.p1  ORF type:complete len:189 (-),score=77.79 TRINITY_DN1126_c0_g1_i4:110-616(-)
MDAKLSLLFLLLAFLSTVWCQASVNTAQTFDVTLATKTLNHLYYGVGNYDGFLIDNYPSKNLSLRVGQTYGFRVLVDCTNHVFYLSTTASGLGLKRYDSETTVRGRPCDGGFLYFTPTNTTPSVLYYASEKGTFMGSSITIVGSSATALKVVVVGVMGVMMRWLVGGW